MSLNYGASSAFYIILTVIVFLLTIGADKTKNRIFPATIVVLLTLVAGLRGYDVGTDTQEYVRIFYVLQAGDQIKEEIGFAIISRVLMRIFNNPSILLLIYSGIIYSLIIWRIWDFRNRISVGLAIFSFYSFFFFESLNIMRQFMAIAFVFWGSKYLAKKSYLKFCLFTLLAISIHSSAVLGFLYLVVEFLSWKELDKKQRRFLTLLSVLGLALSGFILVSFNNLYNRYRHYFLVINRNVGFRVFALIIIFIASILIYRVHYKKHRLSIDVTDKYFIHTTRIYYLVACGMGAVGYFYDYMARLGLYFYPFVFVYFGYIMKEKNTIFWLVVKVMISAVIIYILIQYIFLNNGSGHHPYHVVWN